MTHLLCSVLQLLQNKALCKNGDVLSDYSPSRRDLCRRSWCTIKLELYATSLKFRRVSNRCPCGGWGPDRRNFDFDEGLSHTKWLLRRAPAAHNA